MDLAPIKKDTLRVWLPVVDDFEVLCRYLDQPQFDRIMAEATTYETPAGGGAAVPRRDEQAFRRALARAVVVDWRNLTDDGQAVSCTPETIDYLVDTLGDFRTTVLAAPLSLKRMLDLAKAAAEKNS